MALFKGIKKRSSDAHFLALDIGTDSIKAAVVEAEGKKGRIIGFGKEKQKVSSMQSGMIVDIAAVFEACNSAIRQAENMAGIATSKMVLGVSGELVKGSTHTTSYIRRDKSTKIDLAELKNIVHKIQWKAFEEIRGQMSYETGYNEIDVKLVNATIVDTSIDGYRVTNPIGFQGKEVSITIYNAFSPLVHFGAIQTLAAEIDRELIALICEPYAIANSLIAEDKKKLDAIFIDVGAGATDIAIVKNGVIAGTKMFGIGGRTFTKRLSRSLNVSYYDAESIKVSYCNDKLERQSHRIVREGLKHDIDVWLSGVVLTLEEFKKDDEDLPSKILLSGGAAHLPEIKEVLDTREWVKSLPFTKKPQISYFNPKLIEGVAFDSKIFEGHDDIMILALSKMGLNYVGEECLSSKVLKKVVRLMQI